MTIRHALLTGLALAGLMLLPQGVAAQQTPAQPGQQAPAQQAQPAEPKPEDFWRKECGMNAENQKVCAMQQVVLAAGQFIGSFTLREDPGKESRLLATAAVPLRVMLPFALTLQVDNNKPMKWPYMICDAQSCIAQVVVNEEFINSLKKGSQLKLIYKNMKVTDQTVTINLAGFTAVYEADTPVAQKPAGPQDPSNVQTLQQDLQDRAEQLRREKEAGQPAKQ